MPDMSKFYREKDKGPRGWDWGKAFAEGPNLFQYWDQDRVLSGPSDLAGAVALSKDCFLSSPNLNPEVLKTCFSSSFYAGISWQFSLAIRMATQLAFCSCWGRSSYLCSPHENQVQGKPQKANSSSQWKTQEITLKGAAFTVPPGREAATQHTLQVANALNTSHPTHSTQQFSRNISWSYVNLKVKVKL